MMIGRTPQAWDIKNPYFWLPSACREKEASAKLQQDLVALAAHRAADAAALSACERELGQAQQECAARAEHCRQAEEGAQAAAAKQFKVRGCKDGGRGKLCWHGLGMGLGMGSCLQSCLPSAEKAPRGKDRS